MIELSDLFRASNLCYYVIQLEPQTSESFKDFSCLVRTYARWNLDACQTLKAQISFCMFWHAAI